MNDYKASLRDLRTAKLWLQYMEMIDILRRFIKAERTGNWTLHLQTVQDMLPFFTASGHNLYAKSAYIYLQNMLHLKELKPQVFQSFKEGCHVVRRSDRFWAGLSSDLVIEQVLMRSVKTSGGLTRGRGMTEIQRLVWLLSMPACADINRSMQDITKVIYDSGEQNKDLSKTRQERDVDDTLELFVYLKERNPFGEDPSLHSIATGMVAQSKVNADTAKSVGNNILKEMEGKYINEYSFKKSNQAVTLASKTSVKIGREEVQVDPQLLFQRLITAGERINNLAELFNYELCSYPPALFETYGVLRAANKPALADAIYATLGDTESAKSDGEIHYVIDGGALLHRVQWPKGSTYEEICDRYGTYVSSKYGKATIVFDSYTQGPSTKDCTHQRRSQGQSATLVMFDKGMVCKSKKEEFLANEINKQRFIYLLSDKLTENGCITHHAKGDADRLIVMTAVEMSALTRTALVGDDTDLLILLLYHANLESHDVFFLPEPKKSTKKYRAWDIKAAKISLGTELCNNILFIHAILGCDTTSRVFGFGKGTALKKFQADEDFVKQSQVFSKVGATKKEVIEAGEKALVILYKGSKEEGLDILRYQRFCQKISTSTSHIEPHTLPPTSSAAKYHSFRVYLQVQQWMGSSFMQPQDWGWKIVEKRMIPMSTEMSSAPQVLLEVIRCNCKKDCSSMRCGCKRHGLNCSVSCGECKGLNCTNSEDVNMDEDLVDEYD